MLAELEAQPAGDEAPAAAARNNPATFRQRRLSVMPSPAPSATAAASSTKKGTPKGTLATSPAVAAVSPANASASPAFLSPELQIDDELQEFLEPGSGRAKLTGPFKVDHNSEFGSVKAHRSALPPTPNSPGLAAKARSAAKSATNSVAPPTPAAAAPEPIAEPAAEPVAEPVADSSGLPAALAAMSDEDVRALKVAELRDLLDEMGLSTAGKKVELVQRLLAEKASFGATAAEPVVEAAVVEAAALAKRVTLVEQAAEKVADEPASAPWARGSKRKSVAPSKAEPAAEEVAQEAEEVVAPRGGRAKRAQDVAAEVVPNSAEVEAAEPKGRKRKEAATAEEPAAAPTRATRARRNA